MTDVWASPERRALRKLVVDFTSREIAPNIDQWERDEIEIKLILKGGGCENTNAQYALPMELPHLGRADRSLDGVRKCILHAVWNAQGKGCSPGAVGGYALFHCPAK